MSFWKNLFGKNTEDQPPTPAASSPLSKETTPATESKSMTSLKETASIDIEPSDAETVSPSLPDNSPGVNTAPDKPATAELITSKNRRIRIFISSTFKDMEEERNALMTHAWPELRHFCRERQVELVEVDLRWGISEEQSTRKETLKLCLDEIRACRPFFIGLLGERYGWVPGEDSFTKDLAEEQPWLEGLKDRSVTELEILHGVLNNPEMAGRAFFYFRDPAYALSKGADFLSTSTTDARKQKELKDRIKFFTAKHNIPLRDNYTNPDVLVHLVLEDLKLAMDAQFPANEIPDALEKEISEHEAFAEIRRRTYIARNDYYEALDNHALADGGPLVLLGESGSGKSALLANWIDIWRKRYPKDFIIQHYIGGTADSADHWRIMNRIVNEIARWTSDPEEPPRDHDQLLRDFPLWLVKGRLKAEKDGVRFILVLDALNQLEDKENARLLGWLPEHQFQGPLRPICSTLPGETLDAITKRNWDTKHIESLTVPERRRMIVDYLARFGKKLDDRRLNGLASADTTANPLFLKILLDELRVTGTHEGLDKRLGDYLSTADIPELLGKVLARYQRDYEKDRPGLVRDALGLIYAARRGLTETEILEMLRPDNLPQLSPAVWAPLRAALEESLIDRGGILNFAHDFLRTAVQTAFVPDQDKEDELRLQLAGYFEKQTVSVRTGDELPWLLFHTESLERLWACLLDIDKFLEIFNRNQEELRAYWVWLGEERTMGDHYLDTFNTWMKKSRQKPEHIAHAANQLGFFLDANASYECAETLYRRALAISEKVLGPAHPDTANSLNNLAELLRAKGDLAGAEPLYRRALEICEKVLGNDHPNTALYLNNLAVVVKEMGEYESAESLYHRALDIREKVLGPDHPDTAASLNNLAFLLYSKNDYDGAESLYHKALEIWERVLGADHLYTAASINNLALLLKEKGDYENAEPLFYRALDIREKVLGPDHPDTAASLNNLAFFLYAKGDYVGAEPLLRRALETFENVLGSEHPSTIQILRNLAELLRDKDDYDGAEPLYRRALEINEKALGPKHPDTATSLDNLALLLDFKGDYDGAESLYKRALEIREKTLGPKL